MKKQENGMLEFNVLSLKNEERSEKSYMCPIDSLAVGEWTLKLTGEVGELCDAITQLRECSNYYPQEYLIKNIGKELADVVIYADLLATRLGLRLGYEVKSKFNETSKKIKSKIKL